MKEFTKAEATVRAEFDRAYSVYHLYGEVYGVWDAKGESLVEFDERPADDPRDVLNRIEQLRW